MPEFVRWVFELERSVSVEDGKDWFGRRWTDSFVYVALYLLLILTGRRLMRRRPGFHLRPFLVSWNLALALFSVLGTIRTLPPLIRVISHEDGFYHSICANKYTELNVVGLWALGFAFSKVVELGDTFWIILRKKPLTFLHVYHHVSVLLFTWFTAPKFPALGLYFIALNFLVHSFMYTYYALRAAGVKVHKRLALTITSFQLLQMVIGLIVNSASLNFILTKIPCDTNLNHFMAAFFVYASYFVLFALFFYQRYVSGSGTGTGRLKTGPGPGPVQLEKRSKIKFHSN